MTKNKFSKTNLITWLAKYGTIISLIVLIILFTILRPTIFATGLNLLNILNQSAILGVMSIGLTVCLVMGMFDLSIAAMATFGGYVAALLMTRFGVNSSLTAFLLTLMACCLIGVVNGYIVSYLNVNALIATLASGSILVGLVLGISDSKTIVAGIPEQFGNLGQEATLMVPNSVWVLLLVALILWFVLEYTQLGRNLYAIGGNVRAAVLAGLRVKRYGPAAFAISAVCAGLGGIIAASSLGAGRPQGVGESYLLNAFAAAFIGASTLRPGQFHIGGTVVGVLLIGVINNGLSLIGAPTFWQYIIQGALLIVAMVLAGMALTGRR